MGRGISSRLLASYMLLIALAMGLLCPYLLHAFRQFYLEWIESGVRARSLALANTVGGAVARPGSDLHRPRRPSGPEPAGSEGRAARSGGRMPRGARIHGLIGDGAALRGSAGAARLARCGAGSPFGAAARLQTGLCADAECGR